MKTLPLGRPRRLVDGAAFKALLRNGRRHLQEPIVVRVLPAEKTGGLGLSIAKRLLKNATDRNLVKRIVREAYRVRAADFRNADILVMLAKKPVLKSGEARAQLRAAADGALERAWLRMQPPSAAMDR